MQSTNRLPPSLHFQVNKALHCHALAGKWKDETAESKGAIAAYLLTKNGKRFQAITLETELGQVRQQTGTTYKIDVAKVLKLIEQEKIDLDTLLKGANFSATGLREALGPLHFERVTLPNTSRSLVMKPNDDCKADVRNKTTGNAA